MIDNLVFEKIGLSEDEAKYMKEVFIKMVDARYNKVTAK